MINMNKIIDKPHLIFWISIPIIIIVGLSYGGSTLDINVYDTYFIISQLYISYLISIFFGLIGFGYWMMIKCKRRLTKGLSILHIVSTIGGVLGILISPLVFSNITMKIGMLDMILMILILILLLGQVFYLLNVCIGLIKKRNKTN